MAFVLCVDTQKSLRPGLRKAGKPGGCPEDPFSGAHIGDIWGAGDSDLSLLPDFVCPDKNGNLCFHGGISVYGKACKGERFLAGCHKPGLFLCVIRRGFVWDGGIFLLLYRLFCKKEDGDVPETHWRGGKDQLPVQKHFYELPGGKGDPHFWNGKDAFEKQQGRK